MKVFVTGGSGYIGRSTIETLCRAGHAVEALARSAGSADLVASSGAAPVLGGLGDLDVLQAAASRADAVIHLAQADSGAADQAAANAMQDGVGAGTYVHTGGTWVYGDTDGVADETAPWDPPAIVAWRAPVEDAVLQRARTGGRPVIVRPGLLYGGQNRLIEDFFAAPARATGIPTQIGDGGNHWALIHVEDLAELYVAALSAEPGAVYNGVTGVDPTVADVMGAVSRSIGGGGNVETMTLEQARVRMGPVADAFALDQQFTPDRARYELGWSPRHTDPLTVLAQSA